MLTLFSRFRKIIKRREMVVSKINKSSKLRWVWTLLLAISFIFLGRVNAETFECPFSEVAVKSNVAYSSPLLTSRFGSTMLAYQDTDTQKIFVRFASPDNNTFALQPEYEVGTGQLLSTAQNSNFGMIVYKTTLGAIEGRVIDVIYKEVRSTPANLFSASDNALVVGSVFTSKSGFITWALTGEGATKVKRQVGNSLTIFDEVHVNFTTSFLQAANMDADGTILFMFQEGPQLVGGFFATGSPTTRPVDIIYAVLERGPVPALSNAFVLALESDASQSFMLITGVLRSGKIALQTLHTKDSGGTWTDSLEVGSFTPNPEAIDLVSVVRTDRWIVVLNTDKGLRVLQMTPSFPFEFHWREAFETSFILPFVEDPNRRQITMLPLRSKLIIVGTDKTSGGAPKLTELFCAVDFNSSGSNVGLSKKLLSWFIASLVLLVCYA